MVSSGFAPSRRLFAALDLQLGKPLAEVFALGRGEGEDIPGVVQHGIGTRSRYSQHVGGVVLQFAELQRIPLQSKREVMKLIKRSL